MIVDVICHPFPMVFFAACVSGLVQTALYADFFYYYFVRFEAILAKNDSSLNSLSRWSTCLIILLSSLLPAGKTTQSFSCQLDATNGVELAAVTIKRFYDGGWYPTGQLTLYGTKRVSMLINLCWDGSLFVSNGD